MSTERRRRMGVAAAAIGVMGAAAAAAGFAVMPSRAPTHGVAAVQRPTTASPAPPARPPAPAAPAPEADPEALAGGHPVRWWRERIALLRRATDERTRELLDATLRRAEANGLTVALEGDAVRIGFAAPNAREARLRP
jgi:hypothetical protein